MSVDTSKIPDYSYYVESFHKTRRLIATLLKVGVSQRVVLEDIYEYIVRRG